MTGAFKAQPCEIRFPEHIWKAFPGKKALMHELAYVATLPTPVILKYPVVTYNTPTPAFLDFYHHCFNHAIPNLVEEIPAEKADAVYHRFNSIERRFSKGRSDDRLSAVHGWNNKTVVLPFSFGKDSLLTLGTLKELGYKVILVNIDERVLPRGRSIKKRMAEKLEKQWDFNCHTIENEIHLLCDYQVLEQPETRLHQVHIYFVYLLALIPFCYYYRAPLIAFNNEFHHNLMQLHKEDYLCRHRYMQSREAVKGFADLLQNFTHSQVSIVNLIDVMDNFAIHWILHDKFPQLGQYQVSCHMEMNEYKRWCHGCYRCARAFVFFLAMGIDPFKMGFEASMISEDKKKHFCLFDSPHHPDDRYHQYMAVEEELAFLMAFQKGVKGPLIELFESRFLFGDIDIGKRMDRLKKVVFRLQLTPGSTEVEKSAAIFYESMLKDVSAAV